jgi:flagella basal body P-ring formation protein FlgA
MTAQRRHGKPTRRTRRGKTLAAVSRAALIGLAFWVGADAASGAASASHPHDDILALMEITALSAAEDQGFRDVEVRVRQLDQRLRPALCSEDLTIVRPHNGRVLGPVSYGVRCAGDVPWTLYLRADVSAAVELPTLRRALPRGAVIAESDLQLSRRRVTSRAADLIMDEDMAIGMELKRPLAAGSELHYGQVEPPQLVTRGQMVTLVAGSAGLQVQMQGKAMASGAAGDRLMVTNVNSGRRVEGIVLSDGSVRIP